MNSTTLDRIDWAPVSNGAGEAIPSGAVARVAGTSGGMLTLAKPDTDNAVDVIVIDWSAQISDTQSGQGTFDNRVIVAYETDDGTPAAGEEWGVKAGEWKLRKGYAGFLILGGAGNGLVNAIRRLTPAPRVFGQPYSQPGGLVIWSDETGQWVKGAPGWFWRQETTGTGGTVSRLVFTSPDQSELPVFGQDNTHHLTGIIEIAEDVYEWAGVGGGGTSDKRLEIGFLGGDNGGGPDGWDLTAFFNADQLVLVKESFGFKGYSAVAYNYVFADGTAVVKQCDTNFKCYMHHYAYDGTPGITATLQDGSAFVDGLLAAAGTTPLLTDPGDGIAGGTYP